MRVTTSGRVAGKEEGSGSVPPSRQFRTLRTFVFAKASRHFDRFLSRAIVAIGVKKKNLWIFGKKKRQPRGGRDHRAIRNIERISGEIQCTLVFKVRGRLCKRSRDWLSASARIFFVPLRALIRVDDATRYEINENVGPATDTYIRSGRKIDRHPRRKGLT